MSILVLLETSFGVFIRHPGRSFLTILGIMIGIAAIIATFSIGQGAEERIREQIMALGENSLYVVPGNVIDRGRVRSNLANPAKVTLTDLYALEEEVESIIEISPGLEVMEPMTFGTSSARERIIGSEPNMLIIRGQKVERGIFFNDYHNQKRENVIVMGDVLAKELFKGGIEPIGRTIRIGRTPFTVIGILEHESNYWGTEDPNKRAYIPYMVARKYFKKPDKTIYDLDFVGVKLGDEKIPGEGLRQITRTLRQTHNIKPGDEDDFTIFDQQSIASSAQTASEIIQLFGLVAASISLLVGGIGIMNIMLVSVQERTREIGIRLALGATQGVIQAQFLIEALTLCLLGGIIGIGVGIFIVQLLSTFTNLPGSIALKPLLIALIVTFLVGIFFGYYPARKASKLNPVDALYHS